MPAIAGYIEHLLYCPLASRPRMTCCFQFFDQGVTSCAGRLSLDQAPTGLLSQPSSSGSIGSGGAARRRTLPGPKAALDIGTLMPPSAGPTANE